MEKIGEIDQGLGRALGSQVFHNARRILENRSIMLVASCIVKRPTRPEPPRPDRTIHHSALTLSCSLIIFRSSTEGRGWDRASGVNGCFHVPFFSRAKESKTNMKSNEASHGRSLKIIDKLDIGADESCTYHELSMLFNVVQHQETAIKPGTTEIRNCYCYK